MGFIESKVAEEIVEKREMGFIESKVAEEIVEKREMGFTESRVAEEKVQGDVVFPKILLPGAGSDGGLDKLVLAERSLVLAALIRHRALLFLASTWPPSGTLNSSRMPSDGKHQLGRIHLDRSQASKVLVV
ncbi:hypothetical protein HPP92_004065 [Vanilla planifolia]|uniref:Uncharacterized protein n=1 Tax=Vanilla planifolia TaxID=51239 RepID=A0A835VGG5_VANPL|nr:hypothetical protein HPP92_004485 [Vanilla planifolia]KAG0503993.1 hypothetical protein HPP92_004065 [Vanilla planifolia]